MIPEVIAPDPHGHLIFVERKPDEMLHDYLVRSHVKLVSRIRMLATARDTLLENRDRDRLRWQRRKNALMLGQPVIAAIAWAGLAAQGMTENAPISLTAGLIAAAALAGGPLALAAVHAAEQLSEMWQIRQRRRKHLPPGPMAAEYITHPEEAGFHRYEELRNDRMVVERGNLRLDQDTWLWGFKPLLAVTALVATLFACWRIMLGLPFSSAITDAGIIAAICLVGGLPLLLLCDFIARGLARLATWWRWR